MPRDNGCITLITSKQKKTLNHTKNANIKSIKTKYINDNHYYQLSTKKFRHHYVDNRLLLSSFRLDYSQIFEQRQK